jgi:hypothetical protein
MAKVSEQTPQQNRHYPSKFKTGDLHDDFRILYDHVYKLQDQMAAAEGRMADMESKHGALASQVAGGPSSTKIAGLNVKGTEPQNGRAVASLSGVPVLAYNAASGEIEFTIPS